MAALAALAAVALLAAACGSDDGGNGTASSGESDSGPTTGATQKVTLVLDWTPNTNHSGFYLAQQKGYYRDAGLDVEIVEPGAGGWARRAAADGGRERPVRRLRRRGADPRPRRRRAGGVGGGDHPAQHLLLLAPTDRGITRPRDLAGKTYGGFGGQLEDALVKQMVSCDGGDPSAVKFVEVGNVDYRAGFDQHAFDFVWVFDGWDVIRIRDIDGTAARHAARSSTTRVHPRLVHAAAGHDRVPDQGPPRPGASVRGRHRQGLRRRHGRPGGGHRRADDRRPRVRPGPGQPLSAEYLAPRYATSPAAWGQQDAAVWSTFATWLHDQQIIDEPVDTAAAFTERLPAVRPLTIEVVGLQHAFGPLPVIERLDLRVADGGFVSLIGPSRLRQVHAAAGARRAAGARAAVGPRSAGAPASGSPDSWPSCPSATPLLPWRRALGNATLGAEIAGGRHRRGAGGSRQSRDAARGRARDLFGRFGLAGFEDSWPSQLSGGMRQRVALLRTLLADRDVLALDEPFGALDALTRRELQVWLATVLAERAADGRCS